ncbi:MAG TPA: DUF2513 domain-containing protein [Candidatus Polarisedimenticolaceae bacterium]|nr:DUF2513 domain-containing protein [Candidatus Polarisedimenticolaceae bacterium]
MKRDHDLLRAILLRVEEAGPGPLSESELAIDGFDKTMIGYHVQLLDDAGFVQARFLDLQQRPVPVFTVLRLTSTGHDYLDNIRTPEVWTKTKATIGEQLRSASIEVFAKVAAEIAKAQMGLA